MLPEHVVAKCVCCDTPLLLPATLLASMKLPGIFCKSCWRRYDDLTLRQWFKMDMVIAHLQELDRRHRGAA
jgi:hypothetical protein